MSSTLFHVAGSSKRGLARAFPALALGIGVALTLGSCGDSGPAEITEERVVATPAPPVQQDTAMPAGHPPMGAPQLPDGHPPVDPDMEMTQPPTSFTAAVTEWEAPGSWTKAPDRAMRLVTFMAGAENPAECYITVLSGAAGGVEANANRWRGQMGQPALDAEAVAALPTISVLGKEAALVEVYSPSPGEGQDGRGLLGVICELEDQVVFVKMLGPQASVQAEKDGFVAFCGSLK